MKFYLLLAVISTSLDGVTSMSRQQPWGVTITSKDMITSIRGGDDYVQSLDGVKSKVLESCSEAIDELRSEIVDNGKVVDDFGTRSSSICSTAMQEFTAAATSPGSDGVKAAALEQKLQEVEASVDAPLQVLYLKQLGLVREEALQSFRAAGSMDYQAMLDADSKFVAKAQDSLREGSDWDYTAERSFLQEVLKNICESGRKANQVQMNSAQQQQTAMQFLQSQQQMIQQLQMQLYGQSSPWNVGIAYRIPDTNFNLQGTYQQGRANVQLSCVPDEYAPFLGPNGFTNGVGPGNLGLSLNLSI